MSKPKASQETVNAFIKAVYPEMTDLAVSVGSEETILRDATDKIAALTDPARTCELIAEYLETKGE